MFSDFGDSYRIYRACELVYQLFALEAKSPKRHNYLVKQSPGLNSFAIVYTFPVSSFASIIYMSSSAKKYFEDKLLWESARNEN